MNKNLIYIFLSFVLSINIALAESNRQQDYIIHGIDKELLKNAELRLSILKHADTQPDNFAEQGKDEIKKALQPYGYFRPVIQLSTEIKNNKRIIIFNVDKGMPVRIAKLIITLSGEGKNNYRLNTLIQEFPLKTNDIFSVDEYKKAKETFFITASNEGYIKASIQENKVNIDIKSYRADIIFHFETGKLYKFGMVNFNQHPYSQSFLKRMVNIEEGDHFSTQKLNTLQTSLTNSYYFRQVQIVPDFESISPGNEVPVNIDLVPPKSQRYNIGVGYGSLTGPRLIAGLNLRQLTDTGHHFDAQIKLSSVISGIGAKYYIPGNNPLTDSWITGLNYQRFLPKNGTSSSVTLSQGYLKKENNYQAGVELNYLVDKYKESGVQEKTDTLLYPNLTFGYSTTDNIIHSHTGKSLNLMVRGTSEYLLSSTSFIQFLAKGKYLVSPTDFSHLYLRGTIGYTGVSDFNNLPLSMRFFAGGINSVRGYAEDSIGPGRYLRTGSIEYQNHIKGNWAAAIFYDAGAASNSWRSSLSRGTGVGVIYESMLGPVKLYVAKALDRKSGQYSIEFNIGPEF